MANRGRPSAPKGPSRAQEVDLTVLTVADCRPGRVEVPRARRLASFRDHSGSSRHRSLLPKRLLYPIKEDPTTAEKKNKGGGIVLSSIFKQSTAYILQWFVPPAVRIFFEGPRLTPSR